MTMQPSGATASRSSSTKSSLNSLRACATLKIAIHQCYHVRFSADVLPTTLSRAILVNAMRDVMPLEALKL
uniref:Uncharacterized protein n=1 Tax=Hyaloperonospora arabidopsidis (strain Emoy2) TaxID=559515 RepID=M4C2W4_HYAAE